MKISTLTRRGFGTVRFNAAAGMIAAACGGVGLAGVCEAGTLLGVQEIAAPAGVSSSRVWVTGLNNNGQVCAIYNSINDTGSYQQSYGDKSYTWSASAGVELYASPNGTGDYFRANAINDSGAIAGMYGNYSDGSSLFSAGSNTGITTYSDPCLYRDSGGFLLYSSATSEEKRVYAFTNGGVIAGDRVWWQGPSWTLDTTGTYGNRETNYHSRPGEGKVDLFYLTDYSESGMAVGQGRSTEDGKYYACIATGTGETDNTQLHLISTAGSRATATNDNGQVLGTRIVGTDYYGNGRLSGFLYSGGTVTELPRVSNGFATGADINAQGQIVGNVGTFNSFAGIATSAASLFRSDLSSIDLNTLIDPSLGYTITSASKINDKGQILAQATKDGKTVWVLLNPVTTQILHGSFVAREDGSPVDWNVTPGSKAASATVVSTDIGDALQMVTGSPISIGQDINTPAEPFAITFQYQFETSNATNVLDVLIDGKNVGHLAIDLGQVGQWQNGMVVVSDSTLQALTAANLTFTFDGDSGSQLLLANVDVTTSIPEPASLVAIALAGTGLAMRRRRA